LDFALSRRTSSDGTMVMPWQIYKPALTILLLLVTAATANQGASAAQRLQTLQASLQRSRDSKDWPSSVATARELKLFVNGSPASLLEVARAEIHVGNLAESARNLEQFARMGQSTDLLETSTEFAALRNLAGFSEIERTMKANRTAIGLASTAFLLSDSQLLAEDLDYDRQGKQFLVTSVREKKIISIANGVMHDFAKAPDDWPMLAIKVDSRRGLVWATEVAMQGFVFAAASDWGRSAVLCYELRNGKLRRRIEGPPGSALGDMTLTEDGDAIVSDGEGGGVYRVLLKKDAWERLDNGDFVSPQTPAMHPDGKHIFVPDYVRGIGMLDLATKQVQWLSTENRFALNGIDGLYFDRGRLIAVQNGTSPERVVAFTLNATNTRIESEKIIERSTPTTGDPTHGVTVDDHFYYIANSGWDLVDDHGNFKPGSEPSAPRVMRVSRHLPLAKPR
jgi:sugar lactone lactonase YvrE